MKYYLAYGSNLSVEQMAYRCPDATCIGTTNLEDYRLLFKGSKTGSYLTVEPMKGRKVPCLVWIVNKRDENALDTYEGYPIFYHKIKTDVFLRGLDGREIGEINAFFYQMDTRRKLGIPTASYYNVCEEGYLRFGFDENILETAYYESAKGVAI